MIDKGYIKYHILCQLMEGRNIKDIEKKLIKMVRESIREKIEEMKINQIEEV